MLAAGDDRDLNRLAAGPLTSQAGSPEQGLLAQIEKRGRGSSFRSDLGKRVGQEFDLDLDNNDDEMVNYPDEDQDTSHEGLVDKRYRSDLGKRRYRADLGKRLFLADLEKRRYRADLGKRRYRADLGKRRYRADLGKRSEDLVYQLSGLNENLEKRAGFRSDLGKRGQRWSGRRVFRSDLGKRAYRSDLG
jgi:hypothetical protein